MPALVALQALMLQEGFGFSGAATGASPLKWHCWSSNPSGSAFGSAFGSTFGNKPAGTPPFGAASTTGI